MLSVNIMCNIEIDEKSMNNIVINTRIVNSPITGLQRYTLELLSRLQPGLDQIGPLKPLSRISGALWDQVFLPTQLKGRLLWSPHNSGPISVERQVVTIHDMSPLDHPEWFDPLYARWQRLLIPLVARRAKHIITISNFTKSRLQKICKIPEEKISVIPNGVDQRFKPKKIEEIARVRQFLKLPSPYYLLCVGTIEPRKNIPRLLRAWRAIQKLVGSDVWLVIAGLSGNSEVFVKEQVGQVPPQVHMLGHVSDDHLPALYAGAISLVYLSVYEGFGLPPLESMATATPVIAGNRTSLPEVVGDAALTVDPYDETAIAEALLVMVQDREVRQSYATKGLKRAAQFSWEHTGQLTWKCLQDALRY
jgi:glycosyltransferase involved in cell wall biosynthesis